MNAPSNTVYETDKNINDCHHCINYNSIFNKRKIEATKLKDRVTEKLVNH